MIRTRKSQLSSIFVILTVAVTQVQQTAAWCQDNEQKSGSSPDVMLVIQGVGGAAEYDEVFTDAASKIQSAARLAEANFFWIGKPGQEKIIFQSGQRPANSETDNSDGIVGVDAESDLDRIQAVLKTWESGSSQAWIILIGHGTFDQKSARFNLQGRDVTATQLSDWLTPLNRPVAIINCSSSSAPFINALAGSRRVIVTATKSGFELNYTRFAKYFADAISNPKADIDKDEQVSLLESYLFAAKRVREFYRSEGRLATENALIDDNGDGRGTPLDFFRGVRVIKSAQDDAQADGPVANQIFLIQSEFEKRMSAELKAKRSQLEAGIEALRLKKESMDTDEYYRQLESTLVELAKIYAQAERLGSSAKEPIPPTGDEETNAAADDAARKDKKSTAKPVKDKGPGE